MSDKMWRSLLVGILTVGVVTSSLLIRYTVKLHKQCSIITYIANEDLGGK